MSGRSFQFLSCIVPICCFLVGIISSRSIQESQSQSQYKEPNSSNFFYKENAARLKGHDVDRKLPVLEEQVNGQNQFQEWIRQQQDFPYDCSRILRYNFTIQKDIKSIFDEEERILFAKTLERLATAFKVAIATQRRLVLVLSEKHEKDQSLCQSLHGNDPMHWSLSIYCTWKQREKSCNERLQVDTKTSLAFRNQEGILSEVESSDFFNVQFYGTNIEASLPQSFPWPKSWLIDVTEWDRRWGSFWVKSQLISYIVKNNVLSSEKTPIVPFERRMKIGVILDTSTHLTLAERFARNGTKTHEYERIQALIQYLVGTLDNEDEMNSKDTKQNQITIYTVGSPSLSIDLLQSKAPNERWEIVKVSNLKDIRQGLNIFQQVDFLIGSFASPYFRVVTGLNTAFHMNSYPLSKRRHWGLDIEWFDYQ